MCNSNKGKGTALLDSRRGFLRLGGMSALAAMGGWALPDAVAAPNAAPPKPQNKIDPDEALIRLFSGNQRYVVGLSCKHDFSAEREALALGQNPYAAVLSCADSRVAPEYAFDSARGDIFTVRVAGNFVNNDVLASLEYAVLVLGVPLIMVLGHEGCGAVAAGVKRVKEGAVFPGHIGSLADAIAPSVSSVINRPGRLIDLATHQNVIDNVSRLSVASPLLAEAIADKRLKIAGAIYELATGRVKLIG